MNNPFRFLGFFLFSALAIFSCGETEDPEPIIFTVSSNSVQFEAEGGSQIISITSNSTWTIEAASSWLEVTPMSGTGNTQITLKASSSDLLEAREVNVKGRVGTVVQLISV
ncbi:BACON domain-containing protein [Algoriphagus aquimarinus]|uniref:BACON domain-containing protein n=1 Tax=Algoriphagus aquimarinus TaxID=237018 RepID=UPI0030DC4491|tara:strand:- start:1945 stop:2277 length:333 start_codon:yes stop_codon:yes gene_type:complete